MEIAYGSVGASGTPGVDFASHPVVNGAGREVHELLDPHRVEKIQQRDSVREQIALWLTHRPRNVDLAGKIEAGVPLRAVLV